VRHVRNAGALAALDVDVTRIVHGAGKSAAQVESGFIVAILFSVMEPLFLLSLRAFPGLNRLRKKGLTLTVPKKRTSGAEAPMIPLCKCPG